MFAVAIAFWLALPAMAADFKVPPTPDRYVTDNANALSSDASSSIENELKAYEHATGHQVIVWIGDTTGDVPLETWTTDTAHQWRIGRRGKDDGAILFLFMKDHHIRIEVGYGLESSLTDADSSRIINDIIRPKMRAGDTDGAVSAGVAAMLKTITPAYAAVTAPPSGDEGTVPPLIEGAALRFCGVLCADHPLVRLRHRNANSRQHPVRLSRTARRSARSEEADEDLADVDQRRRWRIVEQQRQRRLQRRR